MLMSSHVAMRGDHIMQDQVHADTNHGIHIMFCHCLTIESLVDLRGNYHVVRFSIICAIIS